MICEYCNGTGQEHDAVKGVTYDCDVCFGSGIAHCFHCGNKATLYDFNGDPSCDDCLADTAPNK